MDAILTLIAAPDKANLNGPEIGRAIGALDMAGAKGLTGPDWLAAGVACDFSFSGLTLEAARDAVGRALHRAPIDAVVQPQAHRRKQLLVADMDSTMITGETVDELAARAGVGRKVAKITARSMRGEIAFADSLRERVALLAGLGVDTLNDVRDNALEPMPGANALVATMRAHGAYTALVSGGFTWFTEAVADRLGFDAHQGNRLEIVDDMLSGRLHEPVINRDGKLRALEAVADACGIGLHESLAVGDGANDLDMLAGAGLGVAFRAKPMVAASAPARIDHGDLTALLYLQGYRDADIVR